MSGIPTDCICTAEQNSDEILPFLRSVVTILKICAAFPILYTRADEDDRAAKKEAWKKVIMVYSSYVVDRSRDCEIECTLRGLIRKTRKYFRIIAGKSNKIPNVRNLDDDTVDKEAMSEGLCVIGQIMEMIVLHPLLYDPQHPDYRDDIKNGTKTLSVWNHICNVICRKDSRNIGFDFNAQFAECMFQRIAVPIAFVDKAKEETLKSASHMQRQGNGFVANITCNGTVNISTRPEISVDHAQSYRSTPDSNNENKENDSDARNVEANGTNRLSESRRRSSRHERSSC